MAHTLTLLTRVRVRRVTLDQGKYTGDQYQYMPRMPRMHYECAVGVLHLCALYLSASTLHLLHLRCICCICAACALHLRCICAA